MTPTVSGARRHRSLLLLLLLVGGVFTLLAGTVPAVAAAGVPSADGTPPSVTRLSPRVGGPAAGASTVVVATQGTGRLTQVYFGSVRATVVAASPGRIVVLPPQQAPGTVHVRVHTPAGNSPPTSSNTFTYIDPPDARQWSAGELVDPGARASGVSCPTAAFCMGVDLDGYAFAYHDDRWYRRVPITQASASLDAVTCVSRTFCAAVDNLGYSYFYRDGVWGTGHRVDGRKLVAISCPTDAFCVAADSGGRVVRYSQGQWDEPLQITPDATSTLSSVSCPTVLTCYASGTTGDFQGFPLVFRQHGNDGWQQLALSSSSSQHLRTAIECPRPKVCVLMQGEQFQTGQFAVQYLDHGVWSQEQIGDGTSSMHFSCPSIRFCLTTQFGPDVSGVNPAGVAPGDIPDSLNFSTPVVVSCPSTARCVVLAGRYAYVGTV